MEDERVILNLLPKIRAFMDEECMPSSSERLLVGVSGGCDSVFLLRSLLALGYPCVVAHCNFRLRGEESDRDERFVRNLCQRLKVKCHVVSFDTRQYASSNHISIEMAARDLRYDCFERLRVSERATAIAVAHHGDDNVETMLLNVLRGTGLKGLKGIDPVRGNVIRPLLCLNRVEIEDAMTRNRWDYVTDSSNLQPDCRRNQVRLWLLPVMERIEPNVRVVLRRLIENLRGDEDFYERYSSMGFNRTQVRQMQKALKAGRTGSMFVNDNYVAVVDRGKIKTRERKTEDAAAVTLDVTERERKEKEVFGNDVLIADADKVALPLRARRWQKGDWFCPYGMGGKRKKMSDFMVDKKIPLTEKANIFVVTDALDRIVWVVGLRSDERVAVTDLTQRVVEVKIEK